MLWNLNIAAEAAAVRHHHVFESCHIPDLLLSYDFAVTNVNADFGITMSSPLEQCQIRKDNSESAKTKSVRTKSNLLEQCQVCWNNSDITKSSPLEHYETTIAFLPLHRYKRL